MAAEKKLLTKRERLALERLASFSLAWSEACITSYHDAFAGDIAEKGTNIAGDDDGAEDAEGLAECIRVTKLARQCSGKNDAVSFSRYVDLLCEEALSKRYLYVLETAKDMAITVEQREKERNQKTQQVSFA